MKFLNILGLLPAAMALPEGPGESVKESVARDTGDASMSPALAARAEAAATVCGSGYSLEHAVPLPKGTDPDMRLGTLFGYTNKDGKGCAILDNNKGDPEYMYLQLCTMDKECDKDSGTFGEYAGPVYVSMSVCAPVTAKMGSTSSDLYIDYKSDYLFACN